MEKGIWLVLFGILLFSFSSFSYFSNSYLLSWDSPGHLAESIVFREYVFPSFYGWNSFFLLGYPIDSYPPMGRILVSVFSFLFDYSAAIKAITIACVFAIPASIYFFVKSLGYSSWQASWTFFSTCLFMSFFNQSNSASLYSAFFVGALSNFISIPLFFLALAFYDKSNKMSTLFSASVVLSHIIFAFNLFVSLLALAFSKIFLFGNSFQDALKPIKIFAAALILSSFWLLPFLYNLHSSSPAVLFLLQSKEKLFSTLAIFVAGLLGCVILFIFFPRGRAAGNDPGNSQSDQTRRFSDPVSPPCGGSDRPLRRHLALVGSPYSRHGSGGPG
ncbi:MAG: hypothetical protein QW275_02810, partial [Candidatus Anstonellaceae archaeon]